MILNKGKKLIAIFAAVLPLGVAGTILFAANNSIRPSKASAYTATLNNANSPELTNGEGTMTDEKNVTWEYHNAADLNNGHVSLNHQGYFGVSASTDWGYTKIQELTVNFSAGTNAELWLLTSIDGNTWNERVILESGVSTSYANNWRYIRFYCWDDDNNGIDVTSVSFGYDCTGVSSSDDVDYATIDGIVNISNLTAAKETTILSPLGNSTEAVKLDKNGNSSNYCDFSLNQEYMIYDLHSYTIELDFYHKNNQTKPTFQFFNATEGVGQSFTYSATKSNYKFTNINSDWWHIELHITSMVAKNVAHKDTLTKNKPVDRIRITTNNCVVDNLRIGCVPSSGNSSLGIYNNGATINNGGWYWMKVSWTGKLHSCTFTYDVPGIVDQEFAPTSLTPFYLLGISQGTVVVTAHVICGYNRSVATISNTITVS